MQESYQEEKDKEAYMQYDKTARLVNMRERMNSTVLFMKSQTMERTKSFSLEKRWYLVKAG